MQSLQLIMYVIVILASVTSVYYSVKYRRQNNPQLRGLYAARMNMGMGIMLVCLSIIQLFLFPGSWVRLTLGVLFMLLGLFNFFAGARNHSHFNSRKN